MSDHSEVVEKPVVEKIDVFKNKAPSCGLLFDDKNNGDILVQDVYVPKVGVAKFTNYCCLQWNVGHNGQGCCGFLDHAEGKCIVFSLWQPMTGKQAVISTFKAAGTLTEAFGDAGTGLQSMNFKLGWKPDKWYTIVIRTWDVDDDATLFGCWVEDQEWQKWTHLITMRFPMRGICFSPSTSSFLEDYQRNGKTLRCVWLKNGYKRLFNKSWAPLSFATFFLNQDDTCKLYRENYDAGCRDNVFYIQTGCATRPSLNLEPGTVFSRVSSSQPHRSVITFKITKAEHDRVEWEITKSITPQFGFAMMGPNANRSEARGTVLWAPKTKVTVTLEDIFGSQVSKTSTIT